MWQCVQHMVGWRTSVVDMCAEGQCCVHTLAGLHPTSTGNLPRARPHSAGTGMRPLFQMEQEEAIGMCSHCGQSCCSPGSVGLRRVGVHVWHLCPGCAAHVELSSPDSPSR